MTEPRPTVSVVFNRPLHQAFTYLIPESCLGKLEPGMLIEAPFGKRSEIGMIIGCGEVGTEEGLFALKELNGRASPDYQLSPEVMELARWVSHYYFCSQGEALSTASMIGFSNESLPVYTVYTVNPDDGRMPATPKQATALLKLRAAYEGPVEALSALAKMAEATTGVINHLIKQGFITKEDRTFAPLLDHPAVHPQLDFTDEQVVAFKPISQCIDSKVFKVFLLHGATGSGKTEIYLQAIKKVLDRGQSALCLVPEISLTPQTVDRFARRFQEEIGVYHSQMTRREKLLLTEKIRRGTIRMVIGARSAVFAPLPDLGLIIIDEEHESSYKQAETPRYHARDVAIVRAQRLAIPVVLGSATPAMESYHNAQQGKYELLRMVKRPTGVALPEVTIVPMGQAAAENPDGAGMISGELKAAIQLRLDKGEQSILFLNRRGFSNFLLCPKCHWVAKCEDDDLVMTIHRKGGKRGKVPQSPEQELALFPEPLEAEQAFLKCHFCGTTSDYPKVCPKCNEGEPMAVGSGTQRIEEAITEMFPKANILRLDQDTMGGRRAFLKAWEEMVSGRAQIILGTQMIAKGLHLDRATLVGVILADVGLFLPDPRAEERTFSLLMQVAGRAGRRDMGQVLLQTYMPEHPVVTLAAAHDYEGFFRDQMVRRGQMSFPPHFRLISLTISDKDQDRARKTARLLAGALRREARMMKEPVSVIGPREAPISRLAGRFRERILIRGKSYRHNAALLDAGLRSRDWNPPSSVRLAIDVDPVDLL